jgi:prepilin-type processing-associated H-X9-DG protein
MMFSIPLAALLALSTTAQAPDGDLQTAAVVPFLGDETVIAVRLDLAKLDVPATVRRIFGKLADEGDLAGITKSAAAWVDALKTAGTGDLFLLVDPGDMPGYPLVVVPLAAKADGRAIADLLTGNRPGAPIRWPVVETIRGAVVAGTPEALARIKNARPTPRPELASALASGTSAPINLAISPSMTQRRALEESMPNLPPPLGGGPITDLTRGMTWASITLTTDPAPTVRLIIRAKDADSARTLQKIAQGGLDQLAIAARSNPSVAELADAISRMKPQVTGDRVSLDADLEKTAALVSVPVRQVREAALRSQCVNNLKQIALAMHNYHQAHDAFPAAYLAAKDGKPLLSWRVLILPFVEQKSLFDQFHLNEPWDSAHNKTLIARMPRIYACPVGSKALAAEGKTTYLTPRGPATLFPGAEGIKLKDVTDGTSNTIMAVDASDDMAVIWTKPDDWEVAPNFQLQGLFGHHPRGTNFGFADGSVHFLKETIMPKVLQALITRDGGEVISSDDY